MYIDILIVGRLHPISLENVNLSFTHMYIPETEKTDDLL